MAMLNVFISLAFAASTPLPTVVDDQFAPAIWSSLYGIDGARYTSLVQFFGSDSANITGRYCKLDQKFQPIDCVAIKLDEDKKTCSLAAYNPKSMQIPTIELDAPNVEKIIFATKVRDKAQIPMLQKTLPIIGFSNNGTARSLPVPVAAEIRYISDRAKISSDYHSEVKQGNLHAELLKYSRLACNDFFRGDGAKNSFLNARQTNLFRCKNYNDSIERHVIRAREAKNEKRAASLEAKKRDCNAYSNQSMSTTTRKDRFITPTINLNLKKQKTSQ